MAKITKTKKKVDQKSPTTSSTLDPTTAIKKAQAIRSEMKKKGGSIKMQKGGGFPDLTKDGKVTKADVLKGRGVFKKGGTVKSKNK